MLSPEVLVGKHALVCGASQGIGQACALELARAGARVTVLARTKDTLAGTVKALNGISSGHNAVICDLSRVESVQAAILEVGQAVDILVCNSGGPAPGPLQSAADQALQEAFSQHVLSQLLLVQAFIPHMKQKGYGRVINIISTSVKVPLPNLGVSNVVRGATASAAKTFANELGPYGITVNNILPGYTKTQRLEQILTNSEKKTGESRSTVEQNFLKDVPAGRFAEAKELAYACVFLASPFAGYINGVNLPVDGGRTGCL